MKRTGRTKQLATIVEGGKRLAAIRDQLVRDVVPGQKLSAVETLAQQLIGQYGGTPSFKLVPGYRHATCISINEGVVHGIPTDRVIQAADVVSLDIGLLFQGWHTDTATTVAAGSPIPADRQFLQAGREALARAIAQAIAGNRVGDISLAIQTTIENAGYACIRTLTGHGIGRQLHEEPSIPCVLMGRIEETPKLVEGQALAIEVIYSQGSPEVKLSPDGWTLATKDQSRAALFEETVIVGAEKPVIVTASEEVWQKPLGKSAVLYPFARIPRR